jgi:S-adenosylmethionine/arginine decarboxylase-like enzyme
MRDLAPDITRQRILIEGHFTIDVDEGVLGAFFDRVTSALELRAYGAPIVFAPGGEGSQNQGFDAFAPLIDSGISVYVWTRQRFASVVAFTCKRFDEQAAVDVTTEFFGMSEVEWTSF